LGAGFADAAGALAGPRTHGPLRWLQSLPAADRASRPASCGHDRARVAGAERRPDAAAGIKKT
jgi:hypothetical protein